MRTQVAALQQQLKFATERARRSDHLQRVVGRLNCETFASKQLAQRALREGAAAIAAQKRHAESQCRAECEVMDMKIQLKHMIAAVTASEYFNKRLKSDLEAARNVKCVLCAALHRTHRHAPADSGGL